MSLAQVSELQPEEFFDRIGSGELPSPPLAICSISSRGNGRRLLLPRSVGDPELSDRLLHGARELLIEQAPGICARGLIPIHLLIADSRTAM